MLRRWGLLFLTGWFGVIPGACAKHPWHTDGGSPYQPTTLADGEHAAGLCAIDAGGDLHLRVRYAPAAEDVASDIPGLYVDYRLSDGAIISRQQIGPDARGPLAPPPALGPVIGIFEPDPRINRGLLGTYGPVLITRDGQARIIWNLGEGKPPASSAESAPPAAPAHATVRRIAQLEPQDRVAYFDGATAVIGHPTATPGEHDYYLLDAAGRRYSIARATRAARMVSNGTVHLLADREQVWRATSAKGGPGAPQPTYLDGRDLPDQVVIRGQYYVLTRNNRFELRRFEDNQVVAKYAGVPKDIVSCDNVVAIATPSALAQVPGAAEALVVLVDGKLSRVERLTGGPPVVLRSGQEPLVGGEGWVLQVHTGHRQRIAGRPVLVVGPHIIARDPRTGAISVSELAR